MSYYNQLKKFLAQAKTNNLKTKHFDSEFLGTEVKVSFGKGTPAKIPWISFLIMPNTTSYGIYPVYLYYKEYDLLILAYGISETNKPFIEWDISNRKTIKTYFEEKYSQNPARYGESYVFKAYDINNLNRDEIDQDLKLIIEEYKKRMAKFKIRNDKKQPPHLKVESFSSAVKEAGLIYSNQLLSRFIASLLTKPFVILTGLSGSGKTKLAQAFVKWICKDETQYSIIPVGADWTNREPLLGYPNALNPEEYVKPDSGVLELIIRATDQPNLPHFLILDEMNLSHVERYFADFLSAMESNEDILLYSEGAVTNGVPARLKIPSNLFIIGTVNIDETTNMFSPKVLDRANTIEFRVTRDQMKDFLADIKPIDMDSLTGKGEDMAKNFLEQSNVGKFATEDSDKINEVLVQFFDELKKTGAEFGYRSATEILRLIHQLTVLDTELTTNQKIDIAIMQKLLPKLHGSRRKLIPVLETLGSFCITGDIKIIKDVFENPDFDLYQQSVLYPLSLEKIARMYRGAIENGFASFAEA